MESLLSKVDHLLEVENARNLAGVQPHAHEDHPPR
jgi:hypothetical protein